MKNIKNIKLLATSLIVTSTVVLGANLISCHESSTNSWGDFKRNANNETALNIVNTTNPNNWSGAIASELKISDFKADNSKQAVTLTITRIKDNITSHGKFMINYKDGDKYDLGAWACSGQPSDDEWSAFQEAAQNQDVNLLLTKAAPWSDTVKFKWQYGTAKQINWAKSETAEWDVYGSNSKTDVYQGMNGKPHFDNDAKTMTAVMSKTSAKGGYDADPIQAVIKYTPGTKYDIKNWTFTKVKQLQSLDTVTSLWNADKAIANASTDETAWINFAKVNWMTFGSVVKNADDHSTSMANTLTHNGQRNLADPQDNQIVNKKSIITDINKGKKFSIVFIISMKDAQNSWSLHLDFNYMFANKPDGTAGDGANGGTAFNYTWTGSLKEN